MIDTNIYLEKLEIALQQKQNDNYREAIKAELAKTEWQNRKFELDKSLSGIKSKEEFEKYQNAIIKLFNDLYEVITAPGVDDFISWLEEITDKNPDNVKKLRKFLVENFTETNISESINSVLSNQDSLTREKSIFSVLLSEIKKQIKKDCNEFLNKPDEFANNIDEFLENLDNILSEISDIERLKDVLVEDLYSEEQKLNNIDFFFDIIKTILEKNQSLKPIDENEKDTSIEEKVKKRISDIEDCIDILDKSGIANSPDEIFKTMFFRFSDDMIKYEGGIKDNLEEFSNNRWSDIESNYHFINSLFLEKKEITYQVEWDHYPQKDEIRALILTYNILVKENPLPLIPNQKSTLSILQSLTKKVNAINDLIALSERIKSEILELFENTISEYEFKNLPLLESLAISNESLKTTIQAINQQLEGLGNGKRSLEKTNDVIAYLLESFTYDLNSYVDISSLFKRALQESGKSQHLEWLETKLNGSDKGDLKAQDFENPNLVKELLAIGLIKINIEKQF